MTKTIIITAGGIGKRMDSVVPKQFIEVNGLPILMHTINRFFDYDNSLEVIVVLPKAHLDFWDELITKHNFKVLHTVVEGGQERFYSIQNGLKASNGELIGVHDGVRPFVALDVIKSVFDATIKYGAVIPVISLKESIRKVTRSESVSLDRNAYRLVQTPQCFTADIIKKAYLQDYTDEFTDDASVVESAGGKIQLVCGNDENIKITTPMDLKLANILV